MRIIGSLLMMAVLFLFPERMSEAARQAIGVWGMDVVPSLFPYMVLSKQLVIKLRGTRISAYAPVFLGLLGGSPSGAAALVEAAGSAVSKRKLYALCTLTGTISPMFIASTVSRWLGSRALGFKLLAAHLLGAALAAALVFMLTPPAGRTPLLHNQNDVSESKEPVWASVRAVLGVGGCIVFFSVMAEAASIFLPVSPVGKAALQGVLEISGGTKALSEAAISVHAKGALCAALLGLSGVSILSQNLLFLRHLGIRMAHLICFGLLRCVCSALLMTGILLVSP